MNKGHMGASNFKQYIRTKKKREKIGVMVAFLDGLDVKVGWSVCCKGDTFDTIDVRILKHMDEVVLQHDAKYPVSLDNLSSKNLNKISALKNGGFFFAAIPNDGEGERMAAECALSDAEKFIPVKYDEQIAYFCDRVVRYFDKDEQNYTIPGWVYSMSEVWKNEYEEEFLFQKGLKKIRAEVEEVAKNLYEEKIMLLLRERSFNTDK